jgi:hypothetical protein
VNPIVDGKVACSRAYALPVFLKAWARLRPIFSRSVYKVGLAPVGSGMMPKFTRPISQRVDGKRLGLVRRK